MSSNWKMRHSSRPLSSLLLHVPQCPLRGTATIQLPEQRLFTPFISKREEQRREKTGWMELPSPVSVCSPTQTVPFSALFIQPPLTLVTVYPITSSYQSRCLLNNVFCTSEHKCTFSAGWSWLHCEKLALQHQHSPVDLRATYIRSAVVP